MYTKPREPFSKNILLLKDVDAVVQTIIEKLREDITVNLKRFGAVIGISGGIDSAVTMALAVKAFGPEKVLGVLIPEKESNPESKKLALQLANQFQIKTVVEDITETLIGLNCYGRRDEAVRRIFPQYDSAECKMKIGIKQNSLYSSLPPVFHITMIDQSGDEKNEILPLKEYLQIVAASNFKQRVRMAIIYYHAELNHYAVVGTPNKHEHDQGFFVKFGDGGADVMPIIGLYKTQVYQLGKYLNIPKEIMERVPTTDTYSAEQTQEEFFYQLPFELMDLYWYGFENKYSPKMIADALGEAEENVVALFNSFERKIKSTEYLRMYPIKYT